MPVFRCSNGKFRWEYEGFEGPCEFISPDHANDNYQKFIREWLDGESNDPIPEAILFELHDDLTKQLRKKGVSNPEQSALNTMDAIWSEKYGSERGKGESTDDCVSRKISIMSKEKGREHDQIVAIAHRVCGAPKPKGE